MCGSWPKDNLKIDNDSIYVDFVGNDFNSPVKIKLLPHKAISFDCILIPKSENLINKYFRLGSNFTNPGNFLNSKRPKLSSKDLKTYWSKKIKLEGNLFQYKIE
jgi:hypothetical protein